MVICMLSTHVNYHLLVILTRSGYMTWNLSQECWVVRIFKIIYTCILWDVICIDLFRNACRIWTCHLYCCYLHMYMSSAYIIWAYAILCAHYLQWSLIYPFLTDNSDVIHISSLVLFIYPIMYNLVSAHCLHKCTLSMSFACCPHM